MVKAFPRRRHGVYIDALMQKFNLSLGLVVVSASIGGALLLSEALLRRWYPVEERKFDLDPELHYVYRPSVRRIHLRSRANGGKIIPVYINAEGRRGAESSFVPEETLVVYGDSVVSSESCSEEDTLAKVLESKLRAQTHADWRVLNAGVIGYGPDQAFLRLKRDLAHFSPAGVVFTIYTLNDYGDLLRNKLFAFDTQNRLVRRTSHVTPELRAEFMKEESRWILRRLLGKAKAQWKQGPPTPLQVKDERDFQDSTLARQKEYESFLDTKDDSVTNLTRDSPDFDLLFTPEKPSARLKIPMLPQLLQEVDRFLSEKKIPWVLLIVPSSIEVDDHWMKRFKADSFLKHAADQVRTQKTGPAHAVPVVNLYPPFEGSCGFTSEKTMTIGMKGCRVAATELLRFFKLD